MQPSKVYRGRWIDSRNTIEATEVFYEFTSAAQAEYLGYDGPTSFTFAVYQMRAFSEAILDGDHAIKTRVFRFLFRRPYPWYLKHKDVELIVMHLGCSEEVAAKALVKNDCDVVNAILDLTT